MAGATLCATRFRGKLNGVIPAIGPSGKAAHNAPAPGGKLLPVEGQVLAVNSRALLGGNIEGEDGALDFGPRSLDRLARLPAPWCGQIPACARRCSPTPAAARAGVRKPEAAGWFRKLLPRLQSRPRRVPACPGRQKRSPLPSYGARISTGSPSSIHLPSTKKPCVLAGVAVICAMALS